MTPPIALSITGSDFKGGAGIQADLKTFAALGVYGTCASAITALTAQNTCGVSGIHVVPAKFVVDQIEAVLDDLAVAAVKTGMLATPAIVSAIAELAEAGRLPKLVIDPVMVASSGDRLPQPEAESLYVEALLPHASMLTPNLREAEVLLGTPIRCLAEQREAAHALLALGPAVVVMKGGHPSARGGLPDARVAQRGRGCRPERVARLNRSDTAALDNLDGWLTTVVGRECLHLLRSRRRRRADLLDPVVRLPDPAVTAVDDDGPEQQVVLADSVSPALLMVLDSLGPSERLAFVLHDLFGVPFDEIAPLAERTPAAARQLGSRARRRVRGKGPSTPDRDRAREREVVEAFYAAVNEGDFAALLAVLDPDVVLHADYRPGRPSTVYRGAETIARQSQAARGAELHPVLVNGLPGVVTVRNARPVSLVSFTVVGGRIVAIDGIRDPDRVRRVTAGVIQSRR